MRITNKTPWPIEALEIDPHGAIINEFGDVAPNSVKDLEIAIYIGEMGGGECRRPMERPITLLEANGTNKDEGEEFVISREAPVGIKASAKANQLMFCVK